VYLIDTNVVSEMRKGSRANRDVRAFFQQAEEKGTAMHLSVVTVGELRRGMEIIRHRGDLSQASSLEHWMAELLNDFSLNILAVDKEVAQLCRVVNFRSTVLTL
jgi:toxin FitB